jgi:succinate dehydrogenase / fumarate reductase iron-sulfur subunit
MPDRLRLRLWRTAREGRSRAGYEQVEVPVERATDSVLDVIERAWSESDSTLVFRHACHHGSCGTCTVRVDGRERLPCITPLADVWDGRAVLTIEPLRGVPLIADLAIDPKEQINRMAVVGFPYVRTVEAEIRSAAGATNSAPDADVGAAERFEDCLECLACVSACPVASGAPEYLGPAVLAAAQRVLEEPRHQDVDRILELVDSDHGIWQCRSAWACSAVCPDDVDPAARIMDLRRRVLTGRGPTNGAMMEPVATGVAR